MKKVLGLFPGLGYFDGIGRSGLAAWLGVCGLQDLEPVLVTYGGQRPPAEVPGRVLHAGTHLRTAVNTLIAGGGSRDVTLVWHLHLLRLLPFLRGDSRVVVYLHGIEAWREMPTPLAKQIAKVDLILTNSDYTWSRFEAANPEFASMRHLTVALGLDQPLRAKVPPPAGPPAALMIGRISRTEAYKGHAALIGCWSEVRRRIPGAELHILGPGDSYDDLRELVAAHGISGVCHLHGPVPQHQKEELIRNSRCMALPSRGEGFGLAYVESMRQGRPCLVSDSDAGREVVNPPEAGLSVNPEDRERLVDSLCRLLSAGAEWDRWSGGALERYATHYTEAAFTRRLNQALELI